MWNGALQFKVWQVAHGSLAYLITHSTLDPVMVSIVGSFPTGSNFLLNFLKLCLYSGLKYKCDLIVKNSSQSVHFKLLFIPDCSYWIYLKWMDYRSIDSDLIYNFPNHHLLKWMNERSITRLLRIKKKNTVYLYYSYYETHTVCCHHLHCTGQRYGQQYNGIHVCNFTLF